MERSVSELDAAIPPHQNVEKSHSSSQDKRQRTLSIKKEQGLISHIFPASNQNHGENTSDLESGPINFTAITLADTGEAPPNMSGDLSLNQYIACCNGRIRSFDKATGKMDGILNMSTDQFFGSVLLPQYYTIQPRVRYDTTTDSWFVLILGVSSWGQIKSQLMIAVAQGAITKDTKWSFFSFIPDAVAPPRASAAIANFPTFGIDIHALYIGVNFFDYSEFVNSDVFVIPKEPLLSNKTLHVTAFRDLIDPITLVGPFTPQGVDNFDSDAAEGYFIGVDATNYGRLILRRVYNPDTLTPTISNNIPISVLSTASPLKVPHKGNTGGVNGYLDGLDDRLTNAHIRNKHLYTAHNVGTNFRGVSSSFKVMTANGCRWYEIDLTDPSRPSLIQAGTLFDPRNSGLDRRHYWMPSIMTNSQGAMVLGCSTAATVEYIDAAYAIRQATDQPGTLRKPSLYTMSRSSYNPSFDTGGALGRGWGDYSRVSLDPSDHLTMWTIQEFCDSTDSYGCQVISISLPK